MNNEKSILDACCGSRMFWFDPKNPNAIFNDKRNESHILCDGRTLNISPDTISSFAAMPFSDEQFSLVVFDPPHLVRLGKQSWLAKKYGKLEAEWEEELTAGFKECFRVLKPNGTLVFKWNETDIPVSKIIALTPHSPLFGNRCGKRSRSHWIVFMKQ